MIKKIKQMFKENVMNQIKWNLQGNRFELVQYILLHRKDGNILEDWDHSIVPDDTEMHS